MKLTDRRLYQAHTFEDFRFRLFYEENARPAQLQRAVATALIEPNYFLVWGTDHSDWDGNVDFKVTKERGSRFVFIKGMEGTVPSKYYVANTLRAKEAGILDAPYHWLHQNAKVNCKSQAQQFWERTKSYVTKLPAMVDFEWTKYMGQWANPTYADLDIWTTEYTRISGIKPLFYSAAGFMNELGKMLMALRDKFSGFVVASYGGALPSMPFGFGPLDWEFHQFASTGNATIISPNDANKKEVDLLYSIHKPAEFDLKYGTVGPIPEPGDEEMTITFTGKVKDTATQKPNVRAQADTSATIVATLSPGTTFQAQGTIVNNDGYGWLNLVSPVAGWLAITVNIEYEPVTPTPIIYPTSVTLNYSDGIKKEYVPK